MRQVLAIAFLFSNFVAGQEPGATPLTLVLKFDGEKPGAAISAMRQEMSTLLKQTNQRVEFRLPDERGVVDEPGNLVVVKFRGNCRMSAPQEIYDERGPLAFTHTADGNVLPFSEVECGRVVRSVKSALWGGERAKADELLGRAMARVVAHELHHILENTPGHTQDGVAKKALTGRQLIQDTLTLMSDRH